MAGGHGHLDDATLLSRPTAEIARLGSRAQMLGVVGLILSVVGFFVAGDAFWQSYLIAYIFWTGITIGSLALLMVQYLSGGAWGLVSRRVFEAVDAHPAAPRGAVRADLGEAAGAVQMGAPGSGDRRDHSLRRRRT